MAARMRSRGNDVGPLLVFKRKKPAVVLLRRLTVTGGM